jgi:hypothetical protein
LRSQTKTVAEIEKIIEKILEEYNLEKLEKERNLLHHYIYMGNKGEAKNSFKKTVISDLNRKRERQKGEETRTSLQLLEPQINLIQGYMTTNINITQTWWRLLSAVGSTLITLVAWLGYMALCMVGEVILGIVKFIFGIIISILSMVVLIGTFIWLLTL